MRRLPLCVDRAEHGGLPLAAVHSNLLQGVVEVLRQERRLLALKMWLGPKRDSPIRARRTPYNCPLLRRPPPSC